MATSAVQASKLHVEGGPSANITGGQTGPINFRVTSSGAETKCDQVLFEGTVEGGTQNSTTVEDLTLTPTLTGCKFLGLAATLMNGCKFTFTGAGQAERTAVVDIIGCTSGKDILIKTVACQITVPEQSGLSHVVFVNEVGPPQSVEAQLTLQGITYTISGPICPAPGVGTFADGDLTGRTTFRAFVDNGSETATHNGHQYNKLKCGAQLGLFAS